MNNLKSYYKLYIKEMFSYPIGFLISIFIDPLMVLVTISLFKSIYAYQGVSSLAGYDLAQMIWYFAGTRFVWYFIYTYVDYTLSQGILSGDLSLILLKPTSIFSATLGEALALRSAGIVFEFIPSFIIYTLFYPPSFMTVASFLRFLLCIALSFFLMFAINFLVGLSSFIFKSNYSMRNLKGILIALLGGANFPLDFYPEWIRNIIDFLPFKYIFYVPLQILVNRKGTQTLADYSMLIGVQLFWITLLFLLCRCLWHKSMKHFCAVGG